MLEDYIDIGTKRGHNDAREIIMEVAKEYGDKGEHAFAMALVDISARIGKLDYAEESKED